MAAHFVDLRGHQQGGGISGPDGSGVRGIMRCPGFGHVPLQAIGQLQDTAVQCRIVERMLCNARLVEMGRDAVDHREQGQFGLLFVQQLVDLVADIRQHLKERRRVFCIVHVVTAAVAGGAAGFGGTVILGQRDAWNHGRAGNGGNPRKRHARPHVEIAAVSGQHVLMGLPDAPGKSGQVGVFLDRVHGLEERQLLPCHVMEERGVELLFEQRLQLGVLEPGDAGVEDRAGAGVDVALGHHRGGQRQALEGTHLLETGGFVEMQVEECLGLQDEAVAGRAVDRTGLQADLASRGLDALDGLESSFVRAADEEQVERTLFQRQGLVGVGLEPGGVTEGNDGHVVGVCRVAGRVVGVVVHHHGAFQQLQVAAAQHGTPLADLFQVDDDAAVGLQQPGVKAAMGAKDEVDRIMPQQVAGQADTQPQTAKLPGKVLRRVQQCICMNISGRRDQADVDCGQAGHGNGVRQ